MYLDNLSVENLDVSQLRVLKQLQFMQKSKIKYVLID